MAAENTDWESCQAKYADILQLFKQKDPTKEEAQKWEKIILGMLKT